MTHSHHFLSRLDRVSMPHVELALHLYREHKLLRFILSRVSLPESAERVALSLADPEQGPFLVVTRDGHFVTCLGEGMLVQNLPVVTRAQIDTIAAKHDELARHMHMFQKLSGSGSKAGSLILRLYDAGDELSREEVVGLLAVQPLLTRRLMRLEVEMVQSLENMRRTVLPVLKRTDKLKPAYRRLLLLYWQTFYSMTHFAVLAGVGGREVLETGEHDRQKIGTFFSTGLFVQGIGVAALRGVWATARMGKLWLPIYKQAYERIDIDDGFHAIEHVMVLAALGMRHAKLRAEARKTLSSMPAVVHQQGPPGDDMRDLVTRLVHNAGVLFDNPEVGIRYQRAMGARMAVTMTKHLPVGSAFRFTREEDVPDDLAFTLAVNNEEDFYTDVIPVRNMFATLPWLSKAQPEQLYLPADFLKAVHTPWTPEHTLGLLRGFRNMAKDHAEAPHDGPTRNGPCPCGSGKKYKRCCGKQLKA